MVPGPICVPGRRFWLLAFYDLGLTQDWEDPGRRFWLFSLPLVEQRDPISPESVGRVSGIAMVDRNNPSPSEQT